MKKTLSLILCAALVAMSFASCSGGGVETTGTEKTHETNGTETTAETEPAVEPAEETVTTETTAPQTFDVVVVSAVAAVISACGYAVTKKRR